MILYIPTRGRVNKQRTWDNLPASLRRDTFLVAPGEEVAAHRAQGRSVLACPVNKPTGMNLAATRDWCLEHARKHGVKSFVLLDDDITLLVRQPLVKGANPRFLTAPPRGQDYEQAFQWLEDSLTEYAHASFGMRQHFWDYDSNVTDKGKPKESIEVGRILGCTMGFRTAALVKAKVQFSKGIGPNSPMSDFNITLQLLLAGHANAISLVYRASPGPANAPGGCAGARTGALQSATAAKLGKLYPEVVKVVTKKAWAGMETETMNDVHIGWKKAYQLGGGEG